MLHIRIFRVSCICCRCQRRCIDTDDSNHSRRRGWRFDFEDDDERRRIIKKGRERKWIGDRYLPFSKSNTDRPTDRPIDRHTRKRSFLPPYLPLESLLIGRSITRATMDLVVCMMENLAGWERMLVCYSLRTRLSFLVATTGTVYYSIWLEVSMISRLLGTCTGTSTSTRFKCWRGGDSFFSIYFLHRHTRRTIHLVSP